MSVSEQDVDRVAELANLELTSGEKASMLRDLNSVLDYFAQLNELDTTGVEPLAHPLPIHNVFRDDEPSPSLQVDAALANVEHSLGSILSFSFFITKKMKVDLHEGQVNGAMPLLYVFLARSGKTIKNVSTVALDDKTGHLLTMTADFDPPPLAASCLTANKAKHRCFRRIFAILRRPPDA